MQGDDYFSAIDETIPEDMFMNKSGEFKAFSSLCQRDWYHISWSDLTCRPWRPGLVIDIYPNVLKYWDT